jgi:hypothetical protein
MFTSLALFSLQRWIHRALYLGVALAMAGGSALAFPWSSKEKAPSDPREYATERASDQNLFKVSFRTEAAAVPVGRLHTWTLRVVNPDDTPVTDAAIAIDGDMPEHRHGLPTKPRMTRHLGNGDYLVEGVKFQMGGWWVMDFTITANGRSDRVRFNLQLRK